MRVVGWGRIGMHWVFLAMALMLIEGEGGRWWSKPSSLMAGDEKLEAFSVIGFPRNLSKCDDGPCDKPEGVGFF